jgi:amino acid adenylation domain-containing protein
MQRRKVRAPNGFVKFPREEVEQSIPARFEQQARLYPERVAVKSRRHRLTYGELEQQANRIAHAVLAGQRKGDDELIAVLLDHDAPVIAAILGVLKAGKIYLPLDPSYPSAWLKALVADAGPALVLTNSSHFDTARELGQRTLPVMNVDEIDPDTIPENLPSSLSPKALAYILFTSGSEGQPKGVCHTHRNVLHRVRGDTNVFRFSREDRISLLSSCAFNASVGDIFGALLNGAALFPFNLKEEGLASLAEWLIQEKITVCHSVPTLFRHLCATLTGSERFPALRLIYLGGEPVCRKDVDLHKRYFSSDSVFINLLGTTETHNITAYVIDKDRAPDEGLVPAGYPFEEQEVFLLAENGVGVAEGIGEIAVRSSYLSSGYWNRPDLTQAKFDCQTGRDERVYRTGDLGQIRPDGCLIHLGRKDSQLKVRGHRIEPMDVELALLDHVAVKDAVVMAEKDREEDTRLVAYIVPAQDSIVTSATLRSFIEGKLPAYMVPSKFVMLATLPLTPNGKVDRQLLSNSGNRQFSYKAEFVAPRTEIESILASIWTEVLDLDSVGVHDNFLDLGGRSLDAMRIVSRIYIAFQLKIDLPIFFDALTIAGLARVVADFVDSP